MPRGMKVGLWVGGLAIILWGISRGVSAVRTVFKSEPALHDPVAEEQAAMVLESLQNAALSSTTIPSDSSTGTPVAATSTAF